MDKKGKMTDCITKRIIFWFFPLPFCGAFNALGCSDTTAQSRLVFHRQEAGMVMNGVNILKRSDLSKNAFYAFVPMSENAFSLPIVKHPDDFLSVSPASVNTGVSTTLAEICSGTPVGYTINVVGAVSYDIAVNNGGLTQSSGTPSAGNNKTASELNDDVWVNNANSVRNIVYTITPVNANAARDAPFTITVPIKPLVKIDYVMQRAPICSGKNASFILLGLLPNFTFTVGYTINGGAIRTVRDVVSDNTGRAEMVVNQIQDSHGQLFSVASLTATNPINVCNAPISAGVQMEVLSLPAARSISAAVLSVCRGTATAIRVPNSEVATGYQLVNRANNALIGAPVFGNRGVINLPTGNLAASTGFHVLATNSSNCVAQMTNVVTIGIAASPAGVDNRLSAVCSHAPANYTLAVAGASSFAIVTYSHGLAQKSGTVSAGSNKAASEIADDAWTNKTRGTVNVVYNIIPVGSNGCRGAAFDITLPVYPSPVAPSSSAIICSNVALNYDLQAQVNNQVSGGNTIVGTFRWKAASNTAVGGESETFQDASVITDLLRNQTPNRQTVVYQVTPTSVEGSCVGDPFIVSIFVNPEPQGGADDFFSCSGAVLNHSLQRNLYTFGNSTRAAFRWSGSASSSSVSGYSTAQQSTPTIADVLINTTSSDQEVRYSVTPTSVAANCVGMPFIITVKVRPQPVGSHYSQLICSKGALNVDLQSKIANSVPCLFSWYANDQPNISGETTSVSASGFITDALENLDNQPRSARYLITPRSTFGCIGERYNVDITVNPRARILAGSDAQVCPAPGVIRLVGTAPYAPLGVQWSGGAGSFSDPASPTAAYTVASSEIGSTIVLTLTAGDPDGTGPCASVASAMRLKINRLPVVGFTAFARAIVYQGDPPLVLTGSQAGGTFTANPSTSTPISTTGPLSHAEVDRSINLDQVTFTPSYARVDVTTTITYSFTDNATGCSNSSSRAILVRPPTNVSFWLGGNTTEAFRFCTNQGKILLEGDPAMKPDGTSSFVSITGNTVVFEGGKYYFETTNLAPGIYSVKYIFDAATNSEVTSDIEIVDAPVARFIADNTQICVGGKITFTDNSIQDGSGGGADTREWSFGDPNLLETDVLYTAGQATAIASYKNSGSFPTSLRIITRLGCAVTSDLTIIHVGAPSAAAFSWAGQCEGNATKFTATSTNSSDTYTWDFGDGNALTLNDVPVPPEKSNNGQTSGRGKTPTHLYTRAKTYRVKLSVGTTSGCTSSQVSRNITILNNEMLGANASYFQDFNSSDAGWVVESYEATNVRLDENITDDTSWLLSIPSGAGHFYTIGDRASLWWTGKRKNNRTTYAQNENSGVLSPCFNLKGIVSPMISLDYCVDTEKDYDGAVLQYSFDDGTPWITIGDNSGNNSINWYNSNNISSKPGNQSGFVYGWTGKAQPSSDNLVWKTAAFSLSSKKTTVERIRFRMAFGSNENDTENAVGFGFDNVFIGEKQRRILIEHFTNTNSEIILSDNKLNVLMGQKNYATDIRYHTQFPTGDKLYLDSPIDPEARALYYNVVQPPFTLVDGKTPESISNNPLGDVGNFTNDVLLKESLTQSLFSLFVQNDDSVTEENSFRVSVRLKAETTFNATILLQVALVEKAVKVGDYTATNVVRKLLFGAGGKVVTRSFKRGEECIEASDKVKIYFPLADVPNNTLYVAFVQDKNSKEIYQSAVIQAPDRKGTPYTGIENTEQSFIFPNPANEFILLPTRHQQAAWTLADKTGRPLLQGELNGSSDYHKENITALAQGIYIVIIHYADKTISRNKIAVVR